MAMSFVQMSLHHHTIYYNFLKVKFNNCYIISPYLARNSNNPKGRISCVKLKSANSAKFTELRSVGAGWPGVPTLWDMAHLHRPRGSRSRRYYNNPCRVFVGNISYRVHNVMIRPYQFDVLFLGQTGAGNRPGWSA